METINQEKLFTGIRYFIVNREIISFDYSYIIVRVYWYRRWKNKRTRFSYRLITSSGRFFCVQRRSFRTTPEEWLKENFKCESYREIKLGESYL